MPFNFKTRNNTIKKILEEMVDITHVLNADRKRRWGVV